MREIAGREPSRESRAPMRGIPHLGVRARAVSRTSHKCCAARLAVMLPDALQVIPDALNV